MVDWQDLHEPHERLRWARLRAGYRTGSAAARASHVEPGTYRSHERSPIDDGRVIDETWAKKYGETFGVHWPWLLTGDATPDTKYAPTNRVELRWQELSMADRALALALLDAAKGA